MRRWHSASATGRPADAGDPPDLPPREFSQLLEQVSASVADPLAKLRFINAALERYRQTCTLMSVASLRPALCRQVLVEVADRLAPSLKLAARHPALVPLAPPARRVGVRRAAGVGLLVMLLMVSYASHRLQARYRTPPTVAAAPPGVMPLLDHFSERLAPAPAADGNPAPAAVPEVWLVEKKAGHEFYSNGLRVATEYETPGEPRRFRTLARAGGELSDVRREPAGLLYHTSEGDVPPFESAFNRSLTQHTRGLLEYIRQNRLYHYLIDRFGRVYRIVSDGGVAYHAGHSIWGDGDDLYLLLNQSFLGLCFEGRWSDPRGGAPAEGGGSVITPAQLHAARQLTDWLRYHFQISDRNCVTHGLVSVNPQRHLIGHHLDWATGFPFRELGLSDKYLLPPPSIVEFGFDYDQHFLQSVGRPWPGLARAGEELQARAARADLPLETLRRQLHRRFDAQMARLRSRNRPEGGL